MNYLREKVKLYGCVRRIGSAVFWAVSNDTTCQLACTFAWKFILDVLFVMLHNMMYYLAESEW